MPIVRTTPPATLPVSLEEAKKHRRIAPDETDDDDTLAGMIAAATEYLDRRRGILGRALVTQTWRFDIPGWRDPIVLPVEPVQSVSVVYDDADAQEQELSSEIYALVRSEDSAPMIRMQRGVTFPTLARTHYPVRVSIVAGYGDAGDVPEPIRSAILMLVGHWFEHRETVVVGTITSEIQKAVDDMIAPFRLWV